MSAAPVIRHDGEAEHLQFAGGGVFAFKATLADTAGALIVFEHRVGRGKATPLHAHPGDDEAIYVVDGEVHLYVEDRVHSIGPRGFFFVPRGVAHAFRVASDTAHLLCIQTPGGVEEFYRRASEPAVGVGDESRTPDVERVHAAAERSVNVTLLGPPPFNPLT